MESGEIEALVECLVANPHDTDALARAHQHGETDPQGYAYLLEQVGTRTEDPSYASHWLSEAANIWSVTIGDAHRAARVLMIAVDRDPTQPLAADRLAQLYRDKGDAKALVAMLDRRVRLLTPMLSGNPAAAESLRGLLATLHEELGKLWNEPPLEQPRKAIDHYKRSIEYDPTSAFAIFSVREIYKSLQQWDEALALYGMELAVERDPERRLMLARDEAATRRLAGDLAGVTGVLRGALEELRRSGGDDPALAQEVAGSVLDRAEAGLPVDDAERTYAANLLAGLAESFDGEHGLAYAAGALDLVHGHDRAMQLYAYYAAAVGADAGRRVAPLSRVRRGEPVGAHGARRTRPPLRGVRGPGSARPGASGARAAQGPGPRHRRAHRGPAAPGVDARHPVARRRHRRHEEPGRRRARRRGYGRDRRCLAAPRRSWREGIVAPGGA